MIIKTQLKETLQCFNMNFEYPLAESIATNLIFLLHAKSNYPYGEAQQYFPTSSHIL